MPRIQPQSHEPVPRLILLAFALLDVRPRRRPLPKPQPRPDIVLQGAPCLARQMLQLKVFARSGAAWPAACRAWH